MNRRAPHITAAVSLFVALEVTAAWCEELAAPQVLNDDGAWCWFQDERAIIDGTTLFVGSVANGTRDPARRGDVDVVAYDLASGRLVQHEIHDRLEPDDHAAPALWRRPAGGVIAVYSRHGSENCFYVREVPCESKAGERAPSVRIVPSEKSRVTYSNLHFLAAENNGRGKLYNFFRGLDASFKPSCASSGDEGASWEAHGVIIDVPLAFRHRPYVKYASNGRDTIHLLYTDGHPRNFDNSVYHVFYRDGRLHRSDGTVVGPLAAGLKQPGDGTLVFRGDARNVAWVSDLQLDVSGRPHAVFSVQKDSDGLDSSDPRAGQDHRYRYASWDGTAWHHHEIAHAGTRLYPGEDDYTGNICLDPVRLRTVYFSTNADPVTGEPLVSSADGRRHYELFRADTADAGATWTHAPITRNSSVDNLRPLVPRWDSVHTALLWFRGTYRTYRDYDTEVVGLFLDDSH